MQKRKVRITHAGSVCDIGSTRVEWEDTEEQILGVRAAKIDLIVEECAIIHLEIIGVNLHIRGEAKFCVSNPQSKTNTAEIKPVSKIIFEDGTVFEA